MGCNHNCAGCSGCAATLELTAGEIQMLQNLGQFAFLPVARRADDTVPVYLEDDLYPPEEYSLILHVLAQKGLISLDFDKPLAGFSSEKYASYPICGSFALTQRGQTVLSILEIDGIS